MWPWAARMVLATAAVTSLLSRATAAASGGARRPLLGLAFIPGAPGPGATSSCSSSSSRRALSSSTAMKSVADLRKEYSASGLEEAELPKDPFPLFRQWLEEAVSAQVVEPNAMCLSTVGPNGRPSGRFVLLKGLDDSGFVWYTNYESRKGQELGAAGAGAACLTFWWGDLERSVRVEGAVERVAEAESTAYFQSRPRGSQMGAWASNQSRPIASRQALEAQYEGVKARFDGEAAEGAAIPKPPHWGGYRLVPDRVEFWKGRQSRLHDRVVYTLQEGGKGWALERLQP